MNKSSFSLSKFIAELGTVHASIHGKRERHWFYVMTATLFLLMVLLILAGGIVRSTGSGLGCPDWPKCFGQWIPPLSVAELPLDYKNLFKIGTREIADFSAFKTWIEYLNRLLGAVVGLVCVVHSFFAFKWRKFLHPGLMKISFLITLLVGVQGGIGARVVSSHLMPWMVTIHMLVALVIFVFLGMMYFCLHFFDRNSIEIDSHLMSDEQKQLQFFWPVSKEQTRKWQKVCYLLLAILLVQILLGSQVREEVDHLIAAHISLQGDFTHLLSFVFLIHRSFSLILVFGTWWLIKDSKKALLSFSKVLTQNKMLEAGKRWKKWQWAMGRWTLLLVFLASIGAVLSYLGLPYWAQPLHLAGAFLLFNQGIELIILLELTFYKKYEFKNQGDLSRQKI